MLNTEDDFDDFGDPAENDGFGEFEAEHDAWEETEERYVVIRFNVNRPAKLKTPATS